MIEYFLQKEAGFFSEFFFMVNNYIYCKKNGEKFSLNTNNWMFRSNIGWTDYFEKFYEDIAENQEIKKQYFGNIIEECAVSEYKKVIPEIYKYNNITQNKIRETMDKLGLTNVEYGSLFIRRGDKLRYESRLFSANIYIQILLLKMPECKTIFIQTDDYECILEAEKYLQENNLNIKIQTICNKDNRGTFMTTYTKYAHTTIKRNIDYMNSINDYAYSCKPVTEMNSDEIYRHTIDMIVGIDIVLNSKYCILDYQSNVSRFIKLAHPLYENVIDIEGNNLFLDKFICPSREGSAYEDFDTLRHT